MLAEALKKKVVSFILIAISLVCIILFVKMAMSADAVSARYQQMSESVASRRDGAKLIFLKAYVTETGDIEFLQTMGKTPNDVGLGSATINGDNSAPEDAIPDAPSNTTPSYSGGTVGFASSMTSGAWSSALKQRNNDAFFKIGNGYSIVKYNGKEYLVENQSSYFGSILNGYNDEGKPVYISNVGCWLFAQVNAINNLTGSTYSVSDLLQARNNKSVVWNASQNKWQPQSATLKYDCGQRVHAQEAPFMANYGIRLTYEGEWNTTVADAINRMTGLRTGDCVYILYFHTDKTCSGNSHWMVVTDIDSQGNIIVLGNANRSHIVPPTGHTLKGDWTCEVSRAFSVRKL